MRNLAADRGAAYLDARSAARSMAITDSAIQGYHLPEAEGSIKSILEFDVDVMRLLNGGELEGDKLPWKKTHQQFRFRAGELTLWHGINGHGKSAVTSQVALWLALQNVKVCIGSFEMLPERTLMRMVKQAAGNPSPSDSFAQSFFMGLCQRMWIYDRRGRVDPQMLFRAIRFAAAEKGVKHYYLRSHPIATSEDIEKAFMKFARELGL